MPKRLVCLHPHGTYMFGDELTVNNQLAANMIDLRSGNYKCWELRKDLGDDEEVAPETPAPAPTQEEVPAPAADASTEAASAEDEAPAKPAGRKAK